MTVEEREDQAQRALNAWRLQTLLLAGYTHHRAEQLANRNDIDIHTAIDLLAHGCPQKLALKILL